ncbi:hypothetical protein Aph01nite_05960 [Acrocarpospora phusangensis]|uniref:Sporulation protein n=1 Tax=Acrocarpospora phusangensis TaxID=1070424 RepID=A0A919Q523_9ACTN|nr:sporulation protein [Acrocarpospora phusangensis]GIH22286.1 hypothetical protein Aph01nite_05960 [Acrocarpospora phusangensis]
MVFKRLLGAFGVGAPSVDTVLSVARVQPGQTLAGQVRLSGGDFDAEIEHVTLHLVARIEIEHGDGEHAGVREFFSVRVSGPFTLASGEQRALDFQIPVPWETPVSQIGGQPLRGMAVGVSTELAIAKAVDKGDLDMIAVEPLPSQLRVLQALLDLGFQFKSADLEAGHVYGVHQDLPFYQEIEFRPSPRYSGLVGELELTFIAGPHSLDVILEADKGAGRFSGDAIGRFQLSHDDALRTDWPAELDRWLSSLAQYGNAHYGHHGHHGHHGSGLGGAVAAGAAGFVGGMVVGEVLEEVFEGDEDEGGDW